MMNSSHARRATMTISRAEMRSSFTRGGRYTPVTMKLACALSATDCVKTLVDAISNTA